MKDDLIDNIANNIEALWPGTSVPICQIKGDKSICTDHSTGKILGEYTLPKLPNGQTMEVFKPYKVKLKKQIKGDEGQVWKKGDTSCIVEMNPGGSLYLECEGVVYNDNAKEGRDFEFI